jgi:Flp pilus assembly pilin Flp
MQRERLHAGQGLIEYAMITVLIAVVVMIILLILGP